MNVARFLFSMALVSPAALPHDLYLMPDPFAAKPGAILLVVYQNGDGFPEGVANVRPERLRRTELVWKGGTVPFTDITAGEKRTTARVRVPGQGTMILLSHTIPNVIELPPETFHKYLRHENLHHVIEWREKNGEADKPGREIYSKYVKSIVHAGAPDGFHAHAAGLVIEFIPEADPASLRPGGEFPVRLLYRGQPRAGAPVECAWLENGKARIETVGRTDAEGRIRVPIRAAGPHRLHTIVMERLEDRSRADWESFWATLTFSIRR